MTDSYQDYLAKLHHTKKIRMEVMIDSVKQVSEAEISSYKRLIAGETNEVYEIAFANRNDMIVRISRAEDPRFDQELWAIERCATVGIPVPEVLSILRTIDGNEQLCLSIQEKMPGTLLSETNLSSAAKKTITTQAGDYLSRIHSIATSGFGYINNKGQAPYRTALDEVRALEDMSEQFIRAGKVAGVKPNLIELAIAISIKEAKIRDTTTSCLIHNDFSAKHILVDGDQITGIIDFGEVSGGQPLTDFIRWSRQTDLPLTWLQEGYQNQSLFTSEFFQHMKVKQIEFGLWCMLNYENYAEGRDKAMQQFLIDLTSLDTQTPQ